MGDEVQLHFNFFWLQAEDPADITGYELSVTGACRITA